MKRRFPRLFAEKQNLPPEAPAKPDAPQAVVIVPGVIESMLLLDKGTPDERRFYADAPRYLLRHMGGFLLGAVEALAFRRCKRLDDLGKGLCEAFVGKLFMRPDGTSLYPLRPMIESAKESTYAAIREAGKWKGVGYGARIALEVAPRAGGDNVFVFCYDWRRGSVKVAQDLRKFIDDVKALTGGKKLSLCGCSYGCQVIAQYLCAGGKDAGRIVFNAPAWRGTGLFRALHETDREHFHFDLPAVRVLTRFTLWETDLEPYARRIPQPIVDEVAFSVVRYALEGGLLYCPGLWCCCAAEDYDELKEKLLDPEENAALIAETDASQHGVMRKIPEILAQAQRDGTQVWCVMNDGTPLLAGRDGVADGVIGVASGAGCPCLPQGTPADGKRGRLSPSGRFDLSQGLLPDRTWVFRGQVHGQSWKDEASRALIGDLLLTGKPETADADPSYPQFTETRCPTDGVSLLFDGGAGTVLPSRGEIGGRLLNDSERRSILVLSVKAEGLPCGVRAARGLLRPGKALPLSFTQTDENSAPACGTLTVRYLKRDPLPLVHKRVFAVRVG